MKTTLALILLMLPAPLLAHDYRARDLTIDHPMAPATPPTARAAAGYMTITNEGDAPDTLVAVETRAAKAGLHRSDVADGVATMTPVERLEIPAGGTVTFAPGGLHVMFMGLDAPFTAGEEVQATLVFEKAGRVDVVFAVEERGEMNDDTHAH